LRICNFPQGKDFRTRNTAALNFVPVLGSDDETILKDLPAILLTWHRSAGACLQGHLRVIHIADTQRAT
jgi:hypothetical protein